MQNERSQFVRRTNRQVYVPDVRFSDPVAATSPGYLRAAAAKLRRQGVREFDRLAHATHTAAMWVDVDPRRPETSVSAYGLRDVGGVALLTVGWTGVADPRHRDVPDIISVLTPVDPTAGLGEMPLVRSLCVGPAAFDGHRRQSRQFEARSESGWLYTALALATQLRLYLAGWMQTVPAVSAGLPVPALGYLVHDRPNPATGVPESGKLYPVSHYPLDTLPPDADADRTFLVWLADGMPAAVECDPVSGEVRRVPGCAPWAVFGTNVRSLDWNTAGPCVRYAID